MVIQAQLRRRRKSRNQRSDARRTMQLLTAGRTPDGKSTEVLIHDLSTGGFLMQTTASMPSQSAGPTDQAALLPRFGERLTALRVGKGLSLDALAEQLGVSRQAVWYWETGQRLPRAEHFKKIAAIFNVPETGLLEQHARQNTGDRSALISELKREIARHNGVDEDRVKIVIEF